MSNELNKRMPYSVPDGFFDELENNVMTAIENDTASWRGIRATERTRTVCLSVLAVAASLLLLFTVARPGNRATAPHNDMEQIDRAFSQLSQSDQKYLLEVYGDEALIDNAATDY